MKKIILASLILFSTTSSFAQWHIRNYFSLGSSTQLSPADLKYNSVNNRQYSLHMNSNGLSVLAYNGSSGNLLGAINYINNGSPVDAIKIVHDGAFSNVLSRLVIGGQTRFALFRFNNSNGSIIWSEYLGSHGFLDENPKDMVIDAAGNIYVAGETPGTAGDVDVFLAKFTSGGALVFNKKYRNPAYNDEVNTLNFDNDLYIGGIAGNVGNSLIRHALAIRLNTNGNILASERIFYFHSCSGVRISKVCLKRNGNRMYMTANSYVGADGNGPLFIAALDPFSCLLLNYKVHDTGPTYVEPWFSYVNGGQEAALNGYASFVNTANPGLVTVLYNLSTLNFYSEKRYTLIPTFAFGGFVVNDFNPSLNEIFVLNPDAANSNNFYTVKANFDGEVSCNTNHDYLPINCFLRQGPWLAAEFIQSCAMLPWPLSGVKLEHKVTTDCFFTPGCDGCKIFQGAEETVFDIQDPEENLTWYPNPASSYIKISSGSKIREISFFDISGKLVKKIENLDGAGTEVDINALEKGIYLLKINMENGNQLSRKLVKE